jgi:uncharacterized membrane protein YuzA (DUF378 family)
MKTLNVITLALIIIGGLNWGLVGFFQYDLVAEIFGGQGSAGARVIYSLVGLSALWQIMPWLRTLSIDEPQAEATHRPVR